MGCDHEHVTCFVLLQYKLNPGPNPVPEPECIVVPVPLRQKVAVSAPVPQHWYLVFKVRVPFSLTKENRRELYGSTCSLLF